MRIDVIVATVDELMELLQARAASGVKLRPDEGLVAVEMVFTALFDNAMGAVPDEAHRDAEKKRHMAAVTRLSSRIVAWPAKPHERQ